MKISTFILLYLLLNNLIYLGQFENGQDYNPFYPNQSNNKSVLGSSHSDVSKQNKLVSETKMNYNSPQAIFSSLNKNNHSLNQNSFVPTKQVNSVDFIKSLIIEDRKIGNQISYELPALNNQSGIHYFEKAYQELTSMLEGKKEMSLKRAVYLTENAFYRGRMSYDYYCSLIKEATNIIKAKMRQEKFSFNDNEAINYMVYQYMSDTLKIRLTGREKSLISFPKTYDFEDPYGYTDVSKMFVTKLLVQNTGQCKSLPLLYLMLVEELGGKAYLSFSPSHSYIKFINNKGDVYNIELTNGKMTTDSWVLGSGYVKSEAIRSGIYLDTINQKQAIAHTLTDLAMYYKWSFGKQDEQQGYDSFNLKCINQTLKYFPNNIFALLEKENYYTALLNYTSDKLRYTDKQQVLNNPQTNQIFLQKNKITAIINGVGFESMPEEAYLDWLKTLETKQQEHNKQYLKFSKMIVNE